MPQEEEINEREYHHVRDLESHGRVEILTDMTQFDAQRLYLLIARHARLTGSVRATAILSEWDQYRPMFRKVMPVEYRRALTELKAIEAAQAQQQRLAAGA
jgi:glutamate synthase (NADPH/NADH) large chain